MRPPNTHFSKEYLEKNIFMSKHLTITSYKNHILFFSPFFENESYIPSNMVSHKELNECNKASIKMVFVMKLFSAKILKHRINKNEAFNYFL